MPRQSRRGCGFHRDATERRHGAGQLHRRMVAGGRSGQSARPAHRALIRRAMRTYCFSYPPASSRLPICMLEYNFGWLTTTIADPEQPINADWVGVGISDEPAPRSNARCKDSTNDRRQDQNEAPRKRPRFSVFDPRKRNPTDPDLRRKNLRMVRRGVPSIQIGTRLNDEGVPAPVVGSGTPRRSEAIPPNSSASLTTRSTWDA